MVHCLWPAGQRRRALAREAADSLLLASSSEGAEQGYAEQDTGEQVAKRQLASTAPLELGSELLQSRVLLRTLLSGSFVLFLPLSQIPRGSFLFWFAFLPLCYSISSFVRPGCGRLSLHSLQQQLSCYTLPLRKLP